LCALADEIVRVEHEQFTIVHMASLPDDGVEEVTRRVDLAVRRVSGWLSQAESFRSPLKVDRIRVLIDPDSYTPTQQRTTIFVPEGRVRKAHADSALMSGDFGIVHEITHVLAESAYRKDRNRFYDDGLAVYLQQKFGPLSNYPSFGPDLHVSTAALASEAGGLLPLGDCDQARRVVDDSEKRRLAYLQLGSFTQFLIENHGINAYFEIYGGAPVTSVTGHSHEELEQEWRSLINSIQ
jgi:hypothetical protein